MCGFAGFLSDVKFSHSPESVLLSMGNAILHRGPDDSGVWCDAETGIGLTHRRLSIIDLSSAGHQPMVSASDRFVIAFNGEIYNHLLLREQLRSCAVHDLSWRGHSDTETLLAGFDAWGIQGTVERAVGMFAFAVWDKMNRVLTLGRDRLGEKPLYYGWQDNAFLFGSELKALKAHPRFNAKISRGAVSLLIRHNYIPAPYSIYEKINKLEPGCLLTVSLSDSSPKIISYWSIFEKSKLGVESPFEGSAAEAVDELEKLTANAVKLQMMADVPLGAFLSGGIDSSTIVALMQTQASRRVKTFTIGFSEEGYNEAVHAKAVAAHLGTDHTELYIPPKDALSVIPKLPYLYDEPFSDSSQIPTFLVSQLAKKDVTVSLSGDAGDELFCGYNRYQITANLWRKLELLPVSFRALAAKSIFSISPKRWDSSVGWIPGLSNYTNIGDKLHKGAGVLTSRSSEALYLALVSHHRDPASLVIDGMEHDTMLTGNLPDLSGLDNIHRMMVLDTATYLPDDILVKVDRAAMGVSLETRVPFLDHRIVEFAWSLPLSMKLRDGQTKWPLRKILSRYVPNELVDRPKMGFGIPLHEWLRGSLKDWAEALLDEKRLEKEGFFYPAPIRKLWLEHLSGKRNWAYLLWNVLMFQAWLEVN